MPWQYFIPILGMLLGNGISGVSVGLSALLEELTTGVAQPPMQTLFIAPSCCLPRLSSKGRYHDRQKASVGTRHGRIRLVGVALPAGKDRIELLLALGASRWEAVQAAVQRCIRIALTPIINQMNVVRALSGPCPGAAHYPAASSSWWEACCARPVPSASS